MNKLLRNVKVFFVGLLITPVYLMVKLVTWFLKIVIELQGQKSEELLNAEALQIVSVNPKLFLTTGKRSPAWVLNHCEKVEEDGERYLNNPEVQELHQKREYATNYIQTTGFSRGAGIKRQEIDEIAESYERDEKLERLQAVAKKLARKFEEAEESEVLLEVEEPEINAKMFEDTLAELQQFEAAVADAPPKKLISFGTPLPKKKAKPSKKKTVKKPLPKKPSKKKKR